GLPVRRRPRRPANLAGVGPVAVAVAGLWESSPADPGAGPGLDGSPPAARSATRPARRVGPAARTAARAVVTAARGAGLATRTTVRSDRAEAPEEFGRGPDLPRAPS